MLKEALQYLRFLAVTKIDGLPAVAVANDVQIKSTVHLLDDAPRKTGTVRAESLASLVDYVERHHDNETAILASPTDNAILGVIDWHSADDDRVKGGFGRHKVELKLQHTEQWKAWLGINGKAMHQKTLAEFIEENLGDIVKPDAASVLEAVLTLSGKRSVNFKNATRLANGDTSLVWEETTEAKAGQTGDMTVPSEIELELPIYQGCEEETTFKIRTMFRYNVEGGSLTFKLQMLGIERIERLAFDGVFESLHEKLNKAEIEVPVYKGAITVTPFQVYAK